MDHHHLPPCGRCGKTDFFAIPDSLALACNACGFVWVAGSNGYEAGATLQEWAEDICELKKKQEHAAADVLPGT